MVDLNSLVIFAQVVEANSFSGAARLLNMPTSTVSRRISDLEGQLGVRLLDRSTRRLRLTDIGSAVFQQARRGVDLGEALDDLVSNHLSRVSGLLRLAAPPSLSRPLIAPLVSSFQALYPDVRVQVFVSDRFVDHGADGIDLAFRIGAVKESALISQKILTYRHQLLASPTYLESHAPPETPQDLLRHRLLSFASTRPEQKWIFVNKRGKQKESVAFQSSLSMNDYTGLASSLLAGAGIGELPPLVQPELLQSGRLVELMPRWRFRIINLSVAHLGNRYLSQAVRVFKEFAARMAPVHFPQLPTWS